VHRAKKIAEISSVLPENKEMLLHTATSFFILPFHHTYNSSTMVRGQPCVRVDFEQLELG